MAIVSPLVSKAPTVKEPLALAGLVKATSRLELPAAHTITTPSLKAALTASSIIGLIVLPRDKLATDLPPCFLCSLTAYSMPLKMEEIAPLPLPPRTLTSTIVTSLATPKVLEPTRPATWSPWSWSQSSSSSSSSSTSSSSSSGSGGGVGRGAGSSIGASGGGVGKGAGVSSGSLIESSGTGSEAGDGVEVGILLGSLVLFLSSISSGERASSSGSPNQSSGPG
ncbi:hypothetical protein WICPIJ_000069, partial [Wickerhamomyces pijperi]